MTAQSTLHLLPWVLLPQRTANQSPSDAQDSPVKIPRPYHSPSPARTGTTCNKTSTTSTQQRPRGRSKGQASSGRQSGRDVFQAYRHPGIDKIESFNGPNILLIAPIFYLLQDGCSRYKEVSGLQEGSLMRHLCQFQAPKVPGVGPSTTCFRGSACCCARVSCLMQTLKPYSSLSAYRTTRKSNQLPWFLKPLFLGAAKTPCRTTDSHPSR